MAGPRAQALKLAAGRPPKGRLNVKSASPFAGCASEMGHLMNCWKTSAFDDKACLQQMTAFQTCLATHVCMFTCQHALGYSLLTNTL